MTDAVKLIILIILSILSFIEFFFFFNVITFNCFHLIQASCVMVTPLQDYTFLNKG